MFRRSPRHRASQASARVPTRQAEVPAPQWIQYFVGVAQKLSGIGRFRLPTIGYLCFAVFGTTLISNNFGQSFPVTKRRLPRAS